MLQILKHSESAEDAVHILQDRAGSFDDDGARENDVINLKRSDTNDVLTSDDENDAMQDETESDYSNIEEITAAAAVEVKNKCPCKKKGLNYFVHKFKLCSRSRPCTICLYLFLTLVILASVVSLIVIGVLILAPFRKAVTFRGIVCTPVRPGPGVTDSTVERRCSCGKGCSSTYPCLRVKVRLNGLHNNSESASILYENESMLMRKCSYYPPCKSSRIANERAVADYERQYGTPGRSYPCLFNPADPREVIRTRRFHLSHVVHGMLWSSVVFLLSLAILIFAVKKKGCDFV